MYDDKGAGRLTLVIERGQPYQTPGDTVVHFACDCCNARDVFRLLQIGFDINTHNRRGRVQLRTARYNWIGIQMY